MKFENEITVEVNMSLEDLKEHLKKLNFTINEEYDLNDIYMLDKNFKDEENYLELLKKSILIRHIIEVDKETKYITYKYKEYNENKEIVKQGKVNCPIISIDKAISLFEALNYEKLISINDHIIAYSNGIDEFIVQYVNDKHIYIEIEDECSFLNKTYETIEDMKDVIKKYNIPIKGDNYFVKKAEIELIEKFDN